MSNTLNKAAASKSKNPLNEFRSYNYIFTLAALKKTALADVESYRNNEDYFVIAKSGGKGTAGIQAPSTGVSAENELLLASFNKNSPGRFDFYINNVVIGTIMAGSEKVNMSLATQIEFEVTEPYSMSGFIEALQVAAVAAGYDQYINAVYMLKMEFIGYPDTDGTPTAKSVENSTRYFVFGFTGLDIDVNESGAIYRCKAVPYNEKGFGEPSRLKANVQLAGNDVASILKSLETGLNKAMQSDAKAAKGNENADKHDIYEIVLPIVNETGIVKDSTDAKWKDYTVSNLLKDSAVYRFADPNEAANTATSVVSINSQNPSTPTIFFAEGANIHECISSIIRDSDYTRNLIATFTDKVDKYGMVPYFIIHMEVEDLGTFDETSHKPFYRYRYVVIPYKIHYTRIPLSRDQTVDTSNLTTLAHREYDYMYTGANVDITRFNLQFNSLFFQAIPIAMGNKKGQPAAIHGVEIDQSSKQMLVDKPTIEVKNSEMGIATVKPYPDFTPVNPKGLANAGQPQTDPYYTLAKNLHQSILENTDQFTAELEIIGDPYYLVTGTMGNYRPVLNEDGTAGAGEAPYATSDVMVVITFRNPSDIDPVSGEAIFDQTTAMYSGVFRVIEVVSIFKDGKFAQTLKLIRIPAQLIDTNLQIKPREAFTKSVPDAVNSPVPARPPVLSSLRATSDSLLASITAGLPVAGLPGQLSNLMSNVTGGLSGNITSAAAGLVQWGKTAASAGVANAVNLADTTLASGLGTVESIGSSAMAAANNLGNGAAGLVSGVASKVSSLTSGNLQGLVKDATAGADLGALGIDVSKLSGLSSNLQSKVSAEIATALKSVPNNVDLNVAKASGMLLENIPKLNLPNIPSTQPFNIAPPPIPSINDIKEIVARGGSLANIPGAAQIPGIDKILSAAKIGFPTGFGVDASAIAGKLSTVQGQMNNITGQIQSIESAVQNITSVIPSGLPTVSSVASSVVNKFGSAASQQASPLITLIKSNS